jgi:hypothetical protein
MFRAISFTPVQRTGLFHCVGFLGLDGQGQAVCQWLNHAGKQIAAK